MSLLVAALTFGVLTNQPRMSLSSKVSEVLAPATPLALRVFYLFDGLKSLPDEGDAAAAALMGTDARAMRELREQLLTDLPAAIPGISRQLQRQASAQASAFQTAPPSAATAVASGDLPIEIMPLATANTAEPRCLPPLHYRGAFCATHGMRTHPKRNSRTRWFVTEFEQGS
ncbi:hypothetical protein T492DRAFT_1129129 [Pavlovales sp. CCMP2436]|nr:hypothetical protein T492DRAFT_1129129 [Pavlovales sp. CCMP2436]